VGFEVEWIGEARGRELGQAAGQRLSELAFDLQKTRSGKSGQGDVPAGDGIIIEEFLTPLRATPAQRQFGDTVAAMKEAVAKDPSSFIQYDKQATDAIAAADKRFFEARDRERDLSPSMRAGYERARAQIFQGWHDASPVMESLPEMEQDEIRAQISAYVESGRGDDRMALLNHPDGQRLAAAADKIRDGSTDRDFVAVNKMHARTGVTIEDSIELRRTYASALYDMGRTGYGMQISRERAEREAERR